MGRGGMTVYLNLDSGGLRRGVTDASRQLRRFDREGTRSVRGVDRATGKLGNTFRSAARYAAGAAAAYISIDQARVAVETTTDLWKATATLHKNLGMSIESASAFSAVAKARGVEVTQLGMAFKALSTNVQQAKDGTDSSVGVFKSLGISIRDLKGTNPEDLLIKIAAGMKEMGPGFERTAAGAKLFGRGWMNILPMLRDGPAALQANLKDARELGAVFDKLGYKNIEDLIAAQRRLKLAQYGLQISFTEAIAPAIEFASKKMADFARIINDPKLTTTQKFNRLGNELQRTLSQVDWNKVGDALARGISMLIPVFTTITATITPPLTEAFARATPAIVMGIAKGLWNSKGAVLSQLANMGSAGGAEFARALGSRVGQGLKSMSQGFGLGLRGIANGAKATGSLVGRAFRSAASAVRSVGSSIAAAMSRAFSRIKSGVSSVRSAFTSAFSSIRSVVQDVANSLSDLMGKVSGLPGKVKSLLGLQRGGPIPGMGTGDKIPALLEPGEFVMNRKAVAAYGLSTMMRMNRAVPRFAKGGFAFNAKEVRKRETALARAELSPGTQDDEDAITALRDYYKMVADTITGRIDKGYYKKLDTVGEFKAFGISLPKKGRREAMRRARARIQDRELTDLLSALQAQKSYEDSLGSLTGTDSSQTELNAQLQQMVQNQRDLLNVSQSQYGVLVQAMAAAVSGHIGGKVGLGMQAPAVAGRVASY